ncbi:T9SS C-terminal target domain-containing protein [uncultured Pontibacter sp.]|uniref:T9SS C-terminal target domain-containing protein n=1 Tax=uncultured Pontibacter sp. TaxID=453356 RepID=UPI00261F9783|nr:T9SS C-terminal target domain-containing protein [uncultured Pontibacter sp.]
MKKLFNLLLVAVVSVSLFACDKDDDPGTTTPKGIEFTMAQESGMMAVSGSTEEDFTMKAGTKYLLKGFVYVKDGATLTIEPGTIIMGDKNSKGTLIVERGGKIMAQGTKEKPIVFTSAQPAGQRAAGDWGGLIVLGKAPVNLGNNARIEGGVDREYGGTDANDNSGVLKYVRIEFSGIAFQPDNEINGLTMGGVGAGTTVDYVQVSYCGDDAFEMFGGTVNAKHLIAYKTVDDMFDTDNGYSGKLQFLLGISDPNMADVSGSNGFESDGDAQGSDATPKTSAIFSNVSLFGPKATESTQFNSNFKRAMHIRRNSNIQVHNSLFAGWPTGLLLDGTKSQANATAGSLAIKNTVISGSSNALTVESGSTFDVAAWFNAADKGNSVVADNATLNISGGFNQTSRPVLTGNSLQSGAAFDGMDNFFERVTYRGAFGSEDWTAGWANFDPISTAY